MEVMVAVLIISLTLGAMLEITRNAGSIYERGENRIYLFPRSSLAFAEPLTEHPSESIDIKAIAESFKMEDDEILNFLKKKDPKLESELFSQIDLTDMEDDEMEDDTDQSQTQALSINIYKLIYKEKDGNSASLFRLKLMNGTNQK